MIASCITNYASNQALSDTIYPISIHLLRNLQALASQFNPHQINASTDIPPLQAHAALFFSEQKSHGLGSVSPR